MSLSLVSINIEGSKHLDTVEAFLRERNPDVVCIQELCEHDIPRFEAIMGAPLYFARMVNLRPGSPLSLREESAPLGIGVCARTPILRQVTHTYHAPEGELGEFNESDDDVHLKRRTQNLALVVSDIEKDGVLYRVGTTHFTWTPKGGADEYQRTDVRALLSITEAEAPLILCGDFNAPRGGEIFSVLLENFKDNIPSHFNTSIDVTLHRSGKARPRDFDDKMVDGLFTSPEYAAKYVDLVFGVSDHAAIVATLDTV